MISKTTDTRITRNKHQLQHQHNKAAEKENPSLWPLKESDNFSEIQNKLSSSTFTRRRPPTTTKSIDENDEDFEMMTTPTSYLIPH